MGYKSVLRSINTAANKATNEVEREAKRTQREQERINKKIVNIEVKMEKIIETLNDQFAKGRINKEEYSKLLQRKPDISIDLIVFGKVAGVSVAKRYICGKISKKEFNEICNNVIPSEVRIEKIKIKKDYDELLNKIEIFKKTCSLIRDNTCQKCGKEKKLFSPIKIIENLKLCNSCSKKLKNLINYKGFIGNFFYINPHKISINEIEKTNLVVGINQEHF